MTIDHARSAAELEKAVERFAELADQAAGAEHVPACPGWSARDLVIHVGTVHRWAAATLLSGQRQPLEPTPLVRGRLGDWYAGCAAALLTAIDAVDPEEPVENFARMHETASFWTRRQLHETTIHVVDLAQALGLKEHGWGVTTDVAADGVDEVLGVFFPRMTARGQRPDVRARVRFDPTDRGDSWIIAPSSQPFGPPLLVHSNGDADASVRGTTSELYLALWKRIPSTRLHADSVAALAVLDGPTVP